MEESIEMLWNFPEFDVDVPTRWKNSKELPDEKPYIRFVQI
ncbi:hypothetical protein AAEO56_16155 [Flavobacterium sp. DGU11]|uniref:Uncharacterized protein n=1 Tax=Flavobacterium arundinis TaxID=3139143 RepID=A0ABU9I054_9FLAO